MGETGILSKVFNQNVPIRELQPNTFLAGSQANVPFKNYNLLAQ